MMGNKRMNEKVRYWLELADYDFETAQAMLDTRRYLYVGFMCHQTIEKALKAVIAEQGHFPPKVHNLALLSDKAGMTLKLTDEQVRFIAELNPLNIESRYPTYKEKDKRVYEIGKRFSASVRENINPQKIILYGSYSRNEQTEDSDIDIAVIYDGFSGDIIDVSSILWRLAWKIDSRIEPVLLDKKNDMSGFAEEVLKTGIEL